MFILLVRMFFLQFQQKDEYFSMDDSKTYATWDIKKKFNFLMTILNEDIGVLEYDNVHDLLYRLKR